MQILWFFSILFFLLLEKALSHKKYVHVQTIDEILYKQISYFQAFDNNNKYFDILIESVDFYRHCKFESVIMCI